MFFIIGFIVVFGSVVTGYTLHGGNLAILWQPTEVIIICGAAIGAFIIANPPSILKAVLKSLSCLLKGDPYGRKDFMELIQFIFIINKIMKSKGLLAIEADIENPHDSKIFNNFPKFAKNHHAVEFFCEYMRLVTMGIDNHYQMEDIITEDLDKHHHAQEQIAGSVVVLGDSLPALGIVAAVLGVIITMGSITEPPEVLGGLIGAALVGTFLGILLSYGLVGPMGQFLGKYFEAESKYIECLAVSILANLKGFAPAVTTELARKNIPEHLRPTFAETEEECNAIDMGELMK